MKIKVLVLFSIILTTQVSLSYAGDNHLILDNLAKGELRAASFQVFTRTDLKITAVGAVSSYSDGLSAGAWIIDAVTREKVWQMTERNTDGRGKDNPLRNFDDLVKFDTGKYELYYYVFGNNFVNIKIDGAGELFDFLGDVFSGKKGMNDIEDAAMVEISGNPNVFKVIDQGTDFKPLLKINPLFQATKIGDSHYSKIYFSITKPVSVHIYMIGEYSKSGREMVDGGWIVDLDSGKRIWEPDRWNTIPAGGARKNRLFNDEVELSPGSYALYCISDDTHGFKEWNATPPDDPYFWGTTITPGKNYQKGSFVIEETPQYSKSLLAISHVGNNVYEQKSFKLLRESKLRVYCFGEADRNERQFADYGWIENNETREIVWELNFNSSIPGGGASKNRMFDGIIKLPEGSYTVFYQTDDSHAYGDWNATPPYDKGNYGISLYAAGEDFKPIVFSLTKYPKEKGNVLVRMTRMSDDIQKCDQFTISQSAKVHVYSIGEGDRDEMYDYGWIKRLDNDLVVWEMTYRNTKPAGGANKNRKFDADIMLDKGSYKACFVTDGSHSYNRWNSAKPRDPDGWGIVITKR
ncbi:MAG: hypothetical protein GY855_08905 [candidate division Zixibacteria bacterium]|nr:hypothetical protein [candidate division Zixibacteria bacterium]